MKQRNLRKIGKLWQQKINSFKTNILSRHTLGHEDKVRVFPKMAKQGKGQNAQKYIKNRVIFYYFGGIGTFMQAAIAHNKTFPDPNIFLNKTEKPLLQLLNDFFPSSF